MLLFLYELNNKKRVIGYILAFTPGFSCQNIAFVISITKSTTYQWPDNA